MRKRLDRKLKKALDGKIIIQSFYLSRLHNKSLKFLNHLLNYILIRIKQKQNRN